MLDVAIAGGGPAGLNAALILGRVRRHTLLVDARTPRNAVSDAVHGFLSRDGASPAELRDQAWQDLGAYSSVETRDAVVESAEPAAEGFEIVLSDGSRHAARRLLLATGLTDELPDIEGLSGLWGRGVFHCPYCHGWEVRDKPLAVLGGDAEAAQLAVYLTRLSADVVLCANGPAALEAPLPEALARCGVRIREERVSRVEGPPGRFERVVFEGDAALPRAALFLRPLTHQRSDLAARLGCVLLDDDMVQVDQNGKTTVPGVYAAGDLCHIPHMKPPTAKAITAAAAGALAGVAMDRDLVFTDVLSGRTATGVVP